MAFLTWAQPSEGEGASNRVLALVRAEMLPAHVIGRNQVFVNVDMIPGN